MSFSRSWTVKHTNTHTQTYTQTIPADWSWRKETPWRERQTTNLIHLYTRAKLESPYHLTIKSFGHAGRSTDPVSAGGPQHSGAEGEKTLWKSGRRRILGHPSLENAGLPTLLKRQRGGEMVKKKLNKCQKSGEYFLACHSSYLVLMKGGCLQIPGGPNEFLELPSIIWFPLR